MIEWGVAQTALGGQPKSGDCHVVRSFPNGALVAVLDGIGHGEEASAAAKTAGRPGRPMLGQYHLLLSAVMKCSVGPWVVMSLRRSMGSGVTWTGVGNVEGLLCARTTPSHQESLALAPGRRPDCRRCRLRLQSRWAIRSSSQPTASATALRWSSAILKFATTNG